MQLEHSFTVPVGIDEAWTVLTDIERVAPCMPGAMLDTVDGDEFAGTVKVKLGPISLTYTGKARFAELDGAQHRAVLSAQGRDSRGNGTAAATVTAQLRAAELGTEVAVITDLDITGKPAQFGRGVMADVGNKLIGQFADCLADTISEREPEPAAPPAATEADTHTAAAAIQPGPADAKEAAPIDLLSWAGPAAAKRLIPVVAALLVVVLLVVRRRASS